MKSLAKFISFHWKNACEKQASIDQLTKAPYSIYWDFTRSLMWLQMSWAFIWHSANYEVWYQSNSAYTNVRLFRAIFHHSCFVGQFFTLYLDNMMIIGIYPVYLIICINQGYNFFAIPFPFSWNIELILNSVKLFSGTYDYCWGVDPCPLHQLQSGIHIADVYALCMTRGWGSGWCVCVWGGGGGGGGGGGERNC